MKNFLSLFAFWAVFSMAANAQDTGITSSVATESKPVAANSDAVAKKAAMKEKFKNATAEEKAKMKAAKKAKMAKKKDPKKDQRKARMEERRKIMKNLTPQQKEALKNEKERHRQEVRKIIGLPDHKEKTSVVKTAN